MAEKTLNTQHTLYRIVSLRNPEKSKTENQAMRFVLYFEADKEKQFQATGQYYDAVVGKTLTETKWKTLSALSFSPYETIDEIEEKYNDFYLASEWLSRNRSTATAIEIYKRLGAMKPLDPKEEVIFWDNLFYTVIKDQNSYIKEAVVQILVLLNLLKQIKLLNKEELIIENIISLANANVVLPITIFEEDKITVSTPAVAKQNNTNTILSKDLMDAQDIAQAKLILNQLEATKQELKKIQSKQNKEFKKDYELAKKEYDSKTKPTLDKYIKEYSDAKFKLETEAQTNKDINTNLISVKYPELPLFEYDVPVEIEVKNIQGKLSELASETINKIIDWNEVETFEEIYKNIEELKTNANKTIVQKTKFSNQYVSFGDTFFPVSKASSKDVVICCEAIIGENYNIIISFTNTIPVDGVEYKLKLQDGSYSPTNNITSPIVYNNGITTITGLFGSNGFAQNINNKAVNIEMTLKMNNVYFKITATNGISLIKARNCVKGTLSESGEVSNPDDFAPKGFGFRQLGIADYKKVVTEICGYRAGEVAHIENIMAGETREKVTTKTHKSEISQTDSQEIESEKLSDTTSTERFEMQTEIAKMQQEQKAFDAYANVQASYGVVSLDAGASYATNSSKEESNRQAVTQAKEQTQRAMERIVSRIKTEKTVKITDEFIEANKHRFENLSNPYNVSGVYRFINAVYKNQIYNYGKRLMYEFMIPQPSKLHRLGLEVIKDNSLKIPTDPRTIVDYNSFDKINNDNYQQLIAEYNAKGVKLYPVLLKTIGKTFSGAKAAENTNEIFEQNLELEIPKGYKTVSVRTKVYGKYDGDSGQAHSFGWTIGNARDNNQDNQTSGINWISNQALEEFTDKISLSYHSLNYLSVTFTFTIQCQITQEGIENWQKETYEAIIAGYDEQLRIFNEIQAIKKAEGIQILDSNPLFYRQTEQLILRKNCISYLIDNENVSSNRRFGIKTYNEGMADDDITFNNHQVDISKKMDDYTSFAKFMEQAFEWNLMSYNFYPFYWGNNAEWDKLYKFETNDPTYRAFMQSGMARVVVTVKPGFENSIMHYMAFGQIWNGGQMPVLGNPLYLSIVDELKEQEYTIEDVWETVVPTSLVALQESGVSIEGGGLPNADSCIIHKDKTILLNDVTVGNLEKLKK
jgi:hypothetical protein